MTRRAIDLNGQVFGRMTVIARAGSDNHQRALWNCRCKCGNTKVISGANLSRGLSRSCGCLRKQQFVQNMHAGRDRYNAKRKAEAAGKRESRLAKRRQERAEAASMKVFQVKFSESASSDLAAAFGYRVRP